MTLRPPAQPPADDVAVGRTLLPPTDFPALSGPALSVPRFASLTSFSRRLLVPRVPRVVRRPDPHPEGESRSSSSLQRMQDLFGNGF